jgi:fatty-acid desaturase
METIGSLVALVLVTLGWHFLFDFGWWQSLFLALLWTTLLGGITGIGLYLHRIARHLGIIQNMD